MKVLAWNHSNTGVCVDIAVFVFYDLDAIKKIQILKIREIYRYWGCMTKHITWTEYNL